MVHAEPQGAVLRRGLRLRGLADRCEAAQAHDWRRLRDLSDVTTPGAGGRSFWLNGSAREYPDCARYALVGMRRMTAGMGQLNVSEVSGSEHLPCDVAGTFVVCGHAAPFRGS